MPNKIFKKIVLGSEVFSGAWGKNFNSRDVKKILEFSYKMGIREIDTAPSYGKINHDVEKIIGDILKRENFKFKISTKFSLINIDLTKKKSLLKKLENQLEGSMSSLNISSIDNYFFHSGSDDEYFNDEIWAFLMNKKKLGFIKNLGLSIRHDLVKKNSLKQLFAMKKYGISKLSTVLNMYSRESLDKVIPYCKKNKIKIYGRMPLAKGLLSGKYNSQSIFKKNDPRSVNPNLTSKIIKFSGTIKNLTPKKSIAWSTKYCDKILVGFKNINQILELNK